MLDSYSVWLSLSECSTGAGARSALYDCLVSVMQVVCVLVVLSTDRHRRGTRRDRYRHGTNPAATVAWPVPARARADLAAAMGALGMEEEEVATTMMSGF